MLAENRGNSPTSPISPYSLVADVAPNTALFRTSERSIPVSRDRISIPDQIRFTILFLPIVLIVLQSYYKRHFLHSLQAAGPFGAEAIYWTARVALFGSFLYALFTKSPTKIARPESPLDLYADERGARDPLLGLRALACLNVLFGHWFLIVFGATIPAASNGEYALRMALSFSPWCGLWMFFTLSGYLMGKGFVTGRHSIDREGLKKFYRNRILRIFPIYFISIFLVAVFVKPHLLDFRSADAVRSLLEAGLFDKEDGGAIIALWSISTEFQFYLLSPMFFIILSQYFNRDRTRIVCAIAICILMGTMKNLLLRYTNAHWFERIYMPLLVNLDCFIAGMTTSFVVNRMLKVERYFRNGFVLGIVVALCSQALFSIWTFYEMAFYTGVPSPPGVLEYLSCAPGVTALLTCLIIGLFELSHRKAGRHNFAWRISTALGLLSYCLYVFHEPVYLSLRKLAPSTVTFQQALMIFPFGSLITVAVAVVFYYFVETEFDKVRR
jgi:peptidoglycan/LPS O-acetylase OafA/YrhL